MTEDNGQSPRWRWEHEQTVQKLRTEYDASYRESVVYRESSDRRFERIEEEMRSMIPIPSQIRNLTASLDKLTEKIESIILTSSTSRRSDWQLALTVLSLFIMVVFSVAKGVH